MCETRKYGCYCEMNEVLFYSMQLYFFKQKCLLSTKNWI